MALHLLHRLPCHAQPNCLDPSCGCPGTPPRLRRSGGFCNSVQSGDANANTERITLPDAGMSFDDYTVGQPDHRGRQFRVVQHGSRRRILAHGQQLLARVQRGRLHRFPTVQCDLGLVRDSIGYRWHQPDSTRRGPLIYTNHWNIPGREFDADSHDHGRRGQPDTNDPDRASGRNRSDRNNATSHGGLYARRKNPP